VHKQGCRGGSRAERERERVRREKGEWGKGLRRKRARGEEGGGGGGCMRAILTGPTCTTVRKLLSSSVLRFRTNDFRRCRPSGDLQRGQRHCSVPQQRIHTYIYMMPLLYIYTYESIYIYSVTALSHNNRAAFQTRAASLLCPPRALAHPPNTSIANRALLLKSTSLECVRATRCTACTTAYNSNVC
jgi:hypothetical protein